MHRHIANLHRSTALAQKFNTPERLVTTMAGIENAWSKRMAVQMVVNGQAVNVSHATGSEPLLWVLREDLGLVGTKFGCGQAACGACTVHVDGVAQRACVTPCAAAQGRAVTTIEGLSQAPAWHPVQQAWHELQVAQCGYCQAGQMMSAAALLRAHPKPTDAQIDEAMSGNLCRCGTYPRIRAAVHRAAHIARGGKA
jgi:isoquinoline 1-oxidoreductase subunit alpha